MNIELRKATQKDADALASMCAEIDQTYLVDEDYFPDTVEKAISWIRPSSDYEYSLGIWRLICVDNKLVGYISVVKQIGAYRRDAIIGFVLRTEYWNQGIMTQTVKEICRLAFETMYIVRISGACLAQNVGSSRVLEKAGFQLEGHKQKAVVKDEVYYDLLSYGLLREAMGIPMPE